MTQNNYERDALSALYDACGARIKEIFTPGLVFGLDVFTESMARFREMPPEEIRKPQQPFSARPYRAPFSPQRIDRHRRFTPHSGKKQKEGDLF